VAIQVVSAVQDLYRLRIPANVDRMMDVLEKAQKQVFSEILPHWGVFCKSYQSPTESIVSLPQGL
jgi:hypothetical protein